MSATTDATGSATIDLADCAGSVCPSYGVAVTVERLTGAAVDVSWDTFVAWDECEHSELEQGRVEIVRDGT
jgi:hypothetical protein